MGYQAALGGAGRAELILYVRKKQRAKIEEIEYGRSQQVVESLGARKNSAMHEDGDVYEQGQCSQSSHCVGYYVRIRIRYSGKPPGVLIQRSRSEILIAHFLSINIFFLTFKLKKNQNKV